ncbi:unnamed protein product [Rotaria magnacalcarata]|uniref:Palmitoyltransferase n=4 Tax=Rotaria magnacalcarata TaxID=392030 RepID=A0A816KE09_9BILA|nr:unnamed protein product [Rotaria magnacalcarata]CAF1404268.1 unnamed protein product [Rotaria magnacalcarata]CAF1918090.1 unnamed protein product [Rotaria magnacalcarata]CAF2109198.1 unnamed protein product [Rotaria magnacalcarata]CAF2142976.1 unnamed protein product [Rotaria magnacalcarata]
MVKKWELIESKNRFYCDGRCLSGHDIGVFILAIVLISITSGLFFAFDCPYLTTRLSPAIPVFAAILFLCVICFIFRTACSDPGILPRGTSDEILYLERSNVANSSHSVALPGRTIEVQMHTGHVLQLKFCSTCKIFRPPRVSHCSLCNACIANFDHHCPWVGNCVGLRNYRYFYSFLFSLSILCLYILSFNITNLILRSQDKPSFIDAIRDTPATIVQAIICFFSIWSIGGLWGYHTYLICRSITTNEDIKHTWNSSRHGVTVKNPFSKGNGCVNCFTTLCGPLPPSFLDLRATIKADGHINRVKNEPMSTTNIEPIIQFQPEDNRRQNNNRIHSTTIHPYSDQKKNRHTPRDYI